MTADRSLSCPKCGTLIAVPPVGIALLDEANGEVTGAVLKRCPRCTAWSWMTPEPQTAR
jgi:ribosomal protein S27AE